MQTILVTGGAGFIGSHTVKQLLKNDYKVVVFDNLFRGHAEAVPAGVDFEKVDLLDKKGLNAAVAGYKIDAVIHFAALAYVGESVTDPGWYYEVNTAGTVNLLNAVTKAGINKVVFSSTCSLYGNAEHIPISESESVKPINPYAKSKYFIEQILSDFHSAGKLSYIPLRYFNAAGCSPDGEIGESHDPETHLIPLVILNALGKGKQLKVFGDDYDTPDGTCIRDYIHVLDLADAHLLALDHLLKGGKPDVFNLGTGTGYSVLEVIKKVEEISGQKVDYVVTGRREGDPAALVADNKKVKEKLGWNPVYGLDEIITHALNWYRNPKY